MATEALGKDINGMVDFSLPLCTSGYRVALSANTEATFSTPPNFNRAFFSYAVGTNVWMGVGSTAVTLPTGTFTSSTVELNPSVRQINTAGGQTLRFISDTASYVQVRFDRGQ